jgi:hypothetical protein
MAPGGDTGPVVAGTGGIDPDGTGTDGTLSDGTAPGGGIGGIGPGASASSETFAGAWRPATSFGTASDDGIGGGLTTAGSEADRAG